MTTAYISPQE